MLYLVSDSEYRTSEMGCNGVCNLNIRIRPVKVSYHRVRRSLVNVHGLILIYVSLAGIGHGAKWIDSTYGQDLLAGDRCGIPGGGGGINEESDKRMDEI